MPKSKACSVIQIGSTRLVDAEVIGEQVGYSAKYINRLAKAGKIPWHGVLNGVKVYRRFDLEEVKAALRHPVEKPGIEMPKPVQKVERDEKRPAKAG